MMRETTQNGSRKNRSRELKAKVALEAIRAEMTLAELSKTYGETCRKLSVRIDEHICSDVCCLRFALQQVSA